MTATTVDQMRLHDGGYKKPQDPDTQMTSSTVSSLSSPVDSGVQLLDSESEITSVMSTSGYCESGDSIAKDPEPDGEPFKKAMTKSDIANRNCTDDFKIFARSAPSYFDRFDGEAQHFSDDVFEMEHPIKGAETDMMNVSLTSYELLDYTLQNKELVVDENVDMHVSMSEEVNENLRLTLNNPKPEPEPEQPVEETVPEKSEEQIVFRRQRKKKSKSDTPKKRVSFHEDILNSTKIDDIHINHGFITHEPDVSLSFFQRGFVRRPDVVKGRYSWAAEGDAPYYEKPDTDREIKSDIYINPQRYSSTSSSSTASNSSSIDEEDSDETNYKKKEPSLKSKPKSSCLKKTKHKKYIDTKIVQEETNMKKKKTESNLLDSNIFGSLKNILSFSTSVPLAERGVPEGQEDFTVYSSSHDASNRRRSLGSLKLKNFEAIEIQPATPVSKISQAKNNLKLTKSEGFYPNYPNQHQQQNVPANIILCDSNVYEHKGISYSYEYDKFQKTFEQQNKPKSSTVYQMILKEFNFFRKKARDKHESVGEDDFEVIDRTTSPTDVEEEKIEEVEEVEVRPNPNPRRYSSSSKLDWSDTETIVSDLSEPQNPRHLSSPKRKVSRNNHYTVSSSYKIPVSDRCDVDMDISKSLQTLRPANSKNSLINRFLKNVTIKKMMDVKSANKDKAPKRIMSLYVKGVKQKFFKDDLDRELEREIRQVREKVKRYEDTLDKKMVIQFRKEIFRSRMERLSRMYYVRSAYTTDGDSRPLMVLLTDSTLYITSSKPNGSYCNHFVLPYTELDTILVGPNGQTVHFANTERDMQCLISTGCSDMTGDLIGRLEVAMRRDVNKPRLPAVKQLGMRDMVNLRKAICKQTSVDKDEEYFYYSIVNIQDFTEISDPTPLGPIKEGPLMFKTAESDSSRWETAYFILKAGVLYMLSSASQRVPMRVFPLINGSCQGARRVFNSHRPHTFQLIIEGKTLLLAAPDEYVVSEWLQELIHAASGTYNQREKNLTQSCSLLMTSDHILTVREAFPCSIGSLLLSRNRHEPIKGAQALSCASIVDLTSFRLPSAEQSWCILEFACREVHEYSGDWILYFSTNSELEQFIYTLENLWQYNNENGDSFPLSTIPETDPLSKKCVDVYTTLIGTWPTNTVLLQFL